MSEALRAAIRDGRAIRSARNRRRQIAERLKRPVRQPTAADIAAIVVDDPEEGWQFAADHWAPGK